MVVIAEDPFICHLLRTILTRSGFEPLILDVPAAVEWLRSPRQPVRALITNNPRAFRTVATDTPLIYTTSSPEASAIDGFHDVQTIQKPFQPKQILAALHAAGSLALL